MTDYGIDEKGDIPELQASNSVVIPKSPIEIACEVVSDLLRIFEATNGDEHLDYAIDLRFDLLLYSKFTNIVRAF